MSLQNKYQEIVDAATAAGTQDLLVREQDGVLYIDGSANGTTKQQLWDLYEKIDPDYASGDLVMNIKVLVAYWKVLN